MGRASGAPHDGRQPQGKFGRKMRHALLVISTFIVIFAPDDTQVLAKEYSKAKWSSKDKLGKWAGSKSKKADVGLPAKPQKRKKLKVTAYKKQDEEERKRICMSYKEDSMSDFLLKFGTVTKLIEDVSEFEMKLKAAEESFAPWRKRRLWKANRGLTGDKFLDEYSLFPSSSTYSGRMGSIRQRPVIKHNHLSEKRKRKKVKSERSDGKFVHACYGYNYLSSMGALANDPSTPSSGPKIPDLDLFREFLMDLGDMNLSDSLIQLADRCMEKNNRQDKVCPALYQEKSDSRSSAEDEASVSPVSSLHAANNCLYSCLTHMDCAEREICCPTQCGGASCYNPSIRAKYRSADGISGAPDKSKKRKKFDASRKCAMADGFLQCLYDGIGERICD